MPRGNAVEQLYQILHERIVDGTYPPGLRMSQFDLSRELSTSRTPLREALNRLQAHGLVIANQNRGMVVAPFRHEMTEQWYAIRLLVEPPLLAAVMSDVTPSDIREMRTALEQMRSNLERTRAYQEAHFRFHSVGLNRYPDAIRSMIETIYMNIERHQSRHFSRPRVAKDFVDVDELLLDAFGSGDPELVRQTLEFHLLDAGLGLALDVDPDQVPKTLIMAARAIGMELDCPANGPLPRPVAMRWTRMSTARLRPIRTSNLEHDAKGTAAEVTGGENRARGKAHDGR